MYLSYVNIKMGTNSVPRFSHGNTLPLTQLPFGMASFCPQTERIKGQEPWFYNPNAPYCEGIRLTHQPSPWIDDFGTFVMMPQNDIIGDTPSAAYSGIANEILSPHYMSLDFLRSGTRVELTPTEYGGMMRLTLNKNRKNYLSFLPVMGEYKYQLFEKEGILFGTANGWSKGNPKRFSMYFAVEFLGDVVDFGSSYEKDNCIHVALKGNKVEVKIGISYINHTFARDAIKREMGGKNFDTLVKEGENNWEEKLSRIEIETDDEEQKRTFYSCMYRAFLFPQKAYEVDRNGEEVHYCASDATYRKGVLYTNTGFWDTSRTQFPLFSLIAREEYAKMLEGFVNCYKESGFLPRWHSLDEVGCMPSTLIDSVILDAVYNGVGTKELWEKALEGMIHHANIKGNEARFGRNGVEEYLKLGYVPCDLYKESVNLTLDAAYGDWCIAQIAKILGKDSIYNEYIKRASNYKNIFDEETGFMRGKDAEGNFRKGFDPTVWGIDYTEGSAWQNSHFVPHDIEGLADLYGGKEKLLNKIDELFNTLPSYRVHGYGSEIHEMTEMATVNFGQCAISNQPSFHIPYLYAYLGEKEKCEYWVGKMCKELFSSSVNGYPGDEDNGSMSAWYILSTLGMYPLCAGKEMIKIKPLVKSAKILKSKIF